MIFDKLYQDFLDQDDPDYTISTYDKLKWCYDKAHRAGWEQAKREADSLLLDLLDVVLESKPVVQSARRVIAAMEYKSRQMSDNDKLLAWQDNGSTPGKPSPDYLNDDAAAMSLLDTLVEKGFHPELYHSVDDDGASEWYFQTHPQASWYHVRPTRREAVVAACLELIEEEASHDV